jgi:hypothetical protein
MPAVDDQYSVEKFPADSSNPSFGDRIGPGCSHRGAQDLNTFVGEHGIKNTGEHAVAVPNQKLELGCAVAQIHQKISRLLGHPGATGIGGDSEEVDSTGRVLHHEQHVHPLQQQRVDAEEVRGKNAPRLLAQNCRQLHPSRRGIDASPQVSVPSQDGGGGDDAMQSAGWGQYPGQCRKHRPVCPGQSRSADLAAYHGDFVAQHEDLRVF